MANICFISPHPDDIELFCGGTLLRHLEQKDQVTIIMLTKGGRGAFNPLVTGRRLEKIREQEAHERYQKINVQLIFANFQDRKVRFNEKSIEKIARILQQYPPDIIYTPEYRTQYNLWKHSDHINGTRITLIAANTINKKILFRCYHSKQTKCLINIDHYFKESQRALRIYRSQYSINMFFFLHFMERNRTLVCKKLGRKIGCQFAEGFREFYSHPPSAAI